MTPLLLWGVKALVASTGFMLLVLMLRAPARRWVGPRLAYMLWALPALRLVSPALPIEDVSRVPLANAMTGPMSVLAIGAPGGASPEVQSALTSIGAGAAAVWAAGTFAVLGFYALRHVRFCARLRADSVETGRIGGVRIVSADVVGPIAFGVFRRFVAVPRDFSRRFDPRERTLVLAHECAHHARGDLIANWVALIVLAAHWWNPVAWVATRAFHDDQEFAADAMVLAGAERSARPLYANLLAKAAGVNAPPACTLNARSNLKGRLMMIARKPGSMRRVALGGTFFFLLGGGALAASVVEPARADAATGRQAVTITVKPDGAGAYTLIVGGKSVAPGASLPDGRTLPASFSPAGGCNLKPEAKPLAMAIKGERGEETYTVMCASAATATVPATLGEGLASLKTMRASVATQPASSAFPETERANALGAIDRSINEVERTLAAIG